MLYWIDGRPVAGLLQSSNLVGTEKFWIDGRPANALFASAAAVTPKMPLLNVGP